MVSLNACAAAHSLITGCSHDDSPCSVDTFVTHMVSSGPVVGWEGALVGVDSERRFLQGYENVFSYVRFCTTKPPEKAWRFLHFLARQVRLKGSHGGLLAIVCVRGCG